MLAALKLTNEVCFISISGSTSTGARDADAIPKNTKPLRQPSEKTQGNKSDGSRLERDIL
jgi:hypothetical protein